MSRVNASTVSRVLGNPLAFQPSSQQAGIRRCESFPVPLALGLSRSHEGGDRMNIVYAVRPAGIVRAPARIG